MRRQKVGTDDEKYMTALKVMSLINAKALPSKQMSIKTGTASNNTVIPKTAGYNNYIYIVTPGVASSYRNEDDYSGCRFYCSIDQSTRKVTAYMEAYHYTNGNIQGWGNHTSITAYYYEFAWN